MNEEIEEGIAENRVKVYAEDHKDVGRESLKNSTINLRILT